jgi:hypothetical protein
MKSHSAEIKEKFAIIQRWESSGMNQLAFCRRENIPTWKFYDWLKKYRLEKVKMPKPTTTGKFVKITPPPRTFTGGVYAEVVFKNGTCIRFHQMVASSELKQLAGL